MSKQTDDRTWHRNDEPILTRFVFPSGPAIYSNRVNGWERFIDTPDAMSRYNADRLALLERVKP